MTKEAPAKRGLQRLVPRPLKIKVELMMRVGKVRVNTPTATDYVVPRQED